MAHATTMRRMYELLSAGDIDGFGELVAEDFVEHEESPGLEPTKEGVKQFFHMYRAAFPDLRMDAEDILVSGDKVVARVRGTGTHQGEFMGMPCDRQEHRCPADRHHPVRRRWTCPRALGRLRRTGDDAATRGHPGISARIAHTSQPGPRFIPRHGTARVLCSAGGAEAGDGPVRRSRRLHGARRRARSRIRPGSPRALLRRDGS